VYYQTDKNLVSKAKRYVNDKSLFLKYILGIFGGDIQWWVRHRKNFKLESIQRWKNISTFSGDFSYIPLRHSLWKRNRVEGRTASWRVKVIGSRLEVKRHRL
jgi:hypothetical protein